jgi:hypothetical protein
VANDLVPVGPPSPQALDYRCRVEEVTRAGVQCAQSQAADNVCDHACGDGAASITGEGINVSAGLVMY